MAEESSDNGATPKKHPEVLGDFKIIRMIGKGGMATVYEAEQISLKRRVALKVLPGHLSFQDEAVKRFRREAEAGGRQSHSGIVAIFGVGEHEGYHYIAEELVEGETSLADLLDDSRQEKALPLGYYQQGAQLIMEVAEALQHAHEAGVIHRDVKPSNVLVTREGKPKVSDFGLAKVEDALALSRTGEFIGTPFYMSPEQAMSRRIGIDHRTDIYSLGVSIYELLTLKRPFDGKTSQEVLKKIIFIEPPNPSKLNARVPRDLSTICLKAMEKNPLRRYQTMAELKEDLNRYLHGEVILARPAGLGVRIGKWIKRHPAAATAASVLIVAALAIVLNWCWSLAQIVKERNKATAINQFLETMLQSPDPDREGREVKVVDVLDKAAIDILGAFPEQPEVEGMLRLILGESYEALGLYKPAEVQKRTALEIFTRFLGEDADDTFLAKNDLATILLYQNRFEEAEPLLQSVVNGWREILGENHNETLTAMNNLAGVLRGLDRLAEAESIYREIMEVRIKNLGESDGYTLRSMNNLAVIHLETGKFDEARKLLEKVRVTGRTAFGESHSITLMALSNLASLNLEQEKYSEAEAQFRELLKVNVEKYGDGHRNTLITRHNLSKSLVEQEKLAEAEELARKFWDDRREVLDLESPITLWAMIKLGQILVIRKKYSEAETLLKQGVEIVDRKFPPHDQNRMEMHSQYGRCLAGQSKFDLAEPHMLAFYEGTKGRLGEKHESVLAAIKDLIGFYEKWGKGEKAEEYKNILTISEDK
ncbi:MAG: tetratricopeptide repeat protein [Planctomycetota bacterium]|jgi:tetratricopeptide (TPR) repeat protein